jgi:hypothetical protein
VSRTLQDDLRDLRHEVAWPPTPDLAAALPELTAALPPRPAGRRWPASRLRAVLASALVVVLAIGAVPPARSAVLDLLNLESGEQARRVRTLPPAPRRESPAQAPGAPTTVARARARVAFPVRLPAVLGVPAAVRVWEGLPGGAVILIYGDRSALWAFEGSSAAYVEKLVTPQSALRRVRVGGARATWITGAPVGFLVRDRNRLAVEGSAAIVDANVLVWREGGVAYRLETRDGLGRALAVARSVGR